MHNRFLWCQEDVAAVNYLRVRQFFPDEVGRIEVTFQAVVAGRMDDRSVRIYLRTNDDSVDIDGFDPDTRFFQVPNWRFWILPDCVQDLPACSAAPGAAEYSYSTWDNGASARGVEWVHWDLFSHADASTAPDRVGRHNWRFRFSGVPPAGWSEINEGRKASHGLRCDSANYFSRFGVDYPEACINSDVIPHLIYDAGESSPHAAVARHIRDALNSADRTYPVIGAGKDIPGKYTRRRDGRGLHRIATVGATYRGNVDEKNAACGATGRYADQTGFGWAAPRQGQECDEYPFASVEEGAANFDWDFSVRPVPSSENESAGGSLINYYFADRILFGDEFWVEIRDSGGGGGGTGPAGFTVDGGPDRSGAEGVPVSLSATVDNADDALVPLAEPTLAWSANPRQDGRGRCTFTPATGHSTQMTCTDDGTYDVVVAAVSDTILAGPSDALTVTLSNRAPRLSISGITDGQRVRTGDTITVQPSVDDVAGDDVTVAVRWGDGTASEDPTAAPASHVYRRPGTFTVQVTATDDDGASDSTEATVTVEGEPQPEPTTTTTPTTRPGATSTTTISTTTIPSTSTTTTTSTSTTSIAGPGGDQLPVTGRASGLEALVALGLITAGTLALIAERRQQRA